LARRWRARLVDPGVAHDRQEPGVQPRSRLELVQAHQRSFDRDLHDVVGVGGLAGQGAGESPEARQHRCDLGAELIAFAHHPLTAQTAQPAGLIPCALLICRDEKGGVKRCREQ